MAELEEQRELIQVYELALNQLGYVYEVGEGGKINFEVADSNLKFCAFVSGKHAEFIRICCVAFYRVSSTDDLLRVYRACNVANERVKVAKTYVLPSLKSVSCAYEAFAEELDVEAVKSAIGSAITVLGPAMKRFADDLTQPS